MVERSAIGGGRAQATRPVQEDGEQACERHGDAGHGSPGAGPADDAGPAGDDGADHAVGPAGSGYPEGEVEAEDGGGYGEEAAAVLAAAFDRSPRSRPSDGAAGARSGDGHLAGEDADAADAHLEETDGRHEAARAVLGSAVERHTVLLYDRGALARAIRELQGRGEPDQDYMGPEDEAPPDADHEPSSEDRHRLHHLRRIARARLGPRRRLAVGSAEMLAKVEAVRAGSPHFAPFLDLVARAVALSHVTDTPLRLAPVLLVGAPGIGKTYTLKRLAAALGSHDAFLSVNMLDTWRLRGLNTSWKGARMGKVAETLLASPVASPVIVLDEFEKAPALGSHDRPYDVFHSLLEEENAEAFVDDFLELALRADHVLWVASANSVDGLPDSILDRMLVMEVPAPTRAQLAGIVDGIYAAACARHGGYFAARLGDEVRDRLARHDPRRLKRIIALALGFAAAAGRDTLLVEDARRAIELAGGARHEGTFRHPVGFAP